MKPTKFPQANKNLLKPESMTDEECGPLEVFTNGTQCISCWKMSIRERLSALIFGRAWLSVFSGETQPPVALWVAREGFENE